MSITLGIKGFRKWLEGKPDDEVVGRCAMPDSCPIAQYLRSQGEEAPEVYPDRKSTRLNSSHRL